MSDTRFSNDHLLVSTDWLADHLKDGDLRVVEVTPPGSGYAIGHIPGAVYLNLAPLFTGSALNVPETMSKPEEAATVLGALGISPDRHVVLADENGGTRSAHVFWLLEYLGFERVSVLEGGMERWMAEGRPSTRIKPEIAAATFTPAPRAERLATGDWIAGRLDSGEIALLDCREDDEYSEGHIPGAVNRPWEQSLVRRAYQGLREPAELQSEFEAAGVGRQKEIVTYCGSGARSAHTYLTLRLLGYDRVRNYAGSWNEWSERPDLPRES